MRCTGDVMDSERSLRKRPNLTIRDMDPDVMYSFRSQSKKLNLNYKEFLEKLMDSYKVKN